VALGFCPRFFGGWFELPLVKSRPKRGGYGLGGFGAVVVAEVVVSEAEGFGEHAAVVGAGAEELLRALFFAMISDERLEVVESDLTCGGVRVAWLCPRGWLWRPRPASRRQRCGPSWPRFSSLAESLTTCGATTATVSSSTLSPSGWPCRERKAGSSSRARLGRTELSRVSMASSKRSS